jgi:hypothetical protein
MSLVLERFVRFPTHIVSALLFPSLAAAATGSVLHALALPDGHCGLGVGGCSTHALLDLAGHGEESLLDIGGALCGGLEEGDAETVCELLYAMLNAALLGLRDSWRTFATVYSTTFLSAISDLLPTSSLLTPSVAYRSISCSHCFTLLNESMSVTS